MRFRSAGLLPALVLSALVACGADDPEDDPDPTASAATTSEESSPSPSPSTPPGPGETNPGKVVPLPAPGTCEPVPESADGRYDLGDLGEVTLRRDDPGALTLDVRSGSGWSTSVNSNNDEAEVEFTQDDDEIDFEADVEGGRLVLQICDGDDD